jgi:glucose-1-phosphate adenylyltransferase
MSRSRKARHGSDEPQRAAVFVLAGGKGTRLHELVDGDCKPALHFGGEARIIDFTLANALNSGLPEVIVATQHNLRSLHVHLGSQWAGQFIDAGGSLMVQDGHRSAPAGFSGTAHAVAASADFIDGLQIDHLVVVAGDHVYQCDYSAFLFDHVASGAAMSVGCVSVPRSEAHQFGILSTNEDGRVLSFNEKPDQANGLALSPDRCLASAGIYILDWRIMRDVLRADLSDPLSQHDFGEDIVPALVAQGLVNAWPLSVPEKSSAHTVYWRDVGTLPSYLAGHLELQSAEPGELIDLHAWPVHARIDFPGKRSLSWLTGRRLRTDSSNAFIASGSCVSASARVERSVVSTRSFVAANVRLTNTIVAPGTHVPQGIVIGDDPCDDARWFRCTRDVVLVTNQMLAARQESRTRWYRKPSGVDLKALNIPSLGIEWPKLGTSGASEKRAI